MIILKYLNKILALNFFNTPITYMISNLRRIANKKPELVSKKKYSKFILITSIIVTFLFKTMLY